MTQYLRAAGPNESIVLDGTLLPGIVTDINVTGRYEIEKKKVAGRDGTNKLGRGYNDAKVAITLVILPPDEHAQVKQIEKAFKASFGAGGAPKVIRIVNQLLDDKDVYNVLFEEFSVRQGSEDDSLLCTINLIEYEPIGAAGAASRLKQQEKLVYGPRGLPTGETAAPGPTQEANAVNSIQANFEAGLTNSVRRLTPGAPPPRNTALPLRHSSRKRLVHRKAHRRGEMTAPTSVHEKMPGRRFPAL